MTEEEKRLRTNAWARRRYQKQRLSLEYKKTASIRNKKYREGSLGQSEEAKAKVAERNKRHRAENKHKEFYVTGEIYQNQKYNSKIRGHDKPKYTLKEFRDWFSIQPNKDQLWIAWIESRYDKWSKPSVDRLDISKGYSFDNIELVDFKTNDSRERKRKKDLLNLKIIS